MTDQQLLAVLFASTSFIVRVGAFEIVGAGDAICDGVTDGFGEARAPRITSPGISFSPNATVTALFTFDLIEMA